MSLTVPTTHYFLIHIFQQIIPSFLRNVFQHQNKKHTQTVAVKILQQLKQTVDDVNKTL